MTLEELKVIINGDASGLNKATNEAGNSVSMLSKKATKSLGSIDSGINATSSNIMSKLLNPKVLVGSGIALFLKNTYNQASDLIEVQNVVDTSFGEMAYAANNFASSAMESFGLSEVAAKKFTGTMASMLKSSGLATEDAAKMSMNLTALAGDIASFNNITADDAFTKIRAGISGETEPLKQLGINMTVANLEAYALAQGIEKSYNAMSQSEQSILRYNYLLSVTSQQQGDFAKTSSSAGNQSKLLSMNYKELVTSIGKYSTALFTPVLRLVNAILAGLTNVIKRVGTLFGFEFNVTDDVTSVGDSFDSVGDNVGSVTDGVDDATAAVKAFKNSLMGIDEINVLPSNDSGAGGSSSGGGGVNGGTITMTPSSVYDEVDKALNKVNDTIKETDTIFGSVNLSSKQIRDTAKYIINDGNLEKMSLMVEKMNEADGLLVSLREVRAKLDAYNWQINLGMQLSKEDQEDYRQLVMQYIDETNRYFVARGEAVTIAMGISLGEDSNIVSLFQDFLVENNAELKRLSKQLEDVMNSALEDGVFTIDEAKEITNIMNQMSSITEKIATAEQKATLAKISIEFESTELSKESYKKLGKEIDDNLEKARKDYGEVYMQTRIGLEALLADGKIDQTNFDKEIKVAETRLRENVAKSEQNALEYKLSILAKMNINLDEANLQNSVDNLLSVAQSCVKGNETSQTFWDDFFSTQAYKLSDGFTQLSGQAKDDVETVLKSLEPQEEQLKTLAQQYLDAGESVPSSISEGLSNISLLKAMTGDISSMYYLMGSQLSDDPEFKKAIDNAIASGVTIPSELLYAMNGQKTNLTNGISGIFSSVNAEIGNGKVSSSNAAYDAGTSTGQSFANGASTKSQTVRNTAYNVMSNSKQGAIDALGLKNGTSSQFDEYGGWTVAGFNTSVSSNGKKSKGIIGTWASNIGNWFAEKMGIHSPSVLFKSFGGYTVEGFNCGLDDNMETTENYLDDWAGILEGWADDIDLGTIAAPLMSDIKMSSLQNTSASMNGLERSINNPLNLILRIGQTDFAKIAVDSINDLIQQEGEFPLDLSYA